MDVIFKFKFYYCYCSTLASLTLIILFVKNINFRFSFSKEKNRKNSQPFGIFKNVLFLTRFFKNSLIILQTCVQVAFVLN
jgi:hypothetical protein